MRTIFSLITAVVITFSTLSAASIDENQIIVRLATENQLIPIYIVTFKDQNANLEKSYIGKLESILTFDLDHNGMTSVADKTTERMNIAAKFGFNENDNADAWKRQNIFYIVKVQIENKNLTARVLSLNSTTSKKIDNVVLTGNLSQDRRQMHRLADMIHKGLFNKDGIASTHFIYTLKKADSKGKQIAEVWEADYDGANARQITNDKALCVNPFYIPAKAGSTPKSFFYVSYRTGQPKIYIASLKDGKAQRLTLLKGNQFMPAINAKQDKVAFICDYTGNPDLFLQPYSSEMGAMGKPQQIFASKKSTQGTPTFNPDGNKVAFVSNKDGSARVYVMAIPAAGAKLSDIKPQLISKHGKESTSPAWSPDGTKLAYSTLTSGSRQIWVYDFNTKEERQLTQGAGHKENPTWAPNSLHIIFNSATNDGSELYLINLNQPEAVKISSGIGEKRFPNWEPK